LTHAILDALAREHLIPVAGVELALTFRREGDALHISGAFDESPVIVQAGDWSPWLTTRAGDADAVFRVHATEVTGTVRVFVSPTFASPTKPRHPFAVGLSDTSALVLNGDPYIVEGLGWTAHRDPRVATTLAKSVMHGLLLAGMANCGKHFPGHGFVKADSHVDIPVDKRSLKAILGDCALPYQWLTTTLTSVMPAHVIYPKVDALPAGFSPRWLQDILRGQLQFNGAIFSDDLSMAGARRIEGRSVSFAQAGVAALNAGCDLVILCNQSIGDGRAVEEMLEGLTEHLVKNQWHASDASEQRRRALLPTTSPLAWDALMTYPAYLRALDLLP
jgi:hypothetical protein